MLLNITVNINNVPDNIPADDIANVVESVVSRFTSSAVSTSIYDNDGSSTQNPIMASNMLRKIRG